MRKNGFPMIIVAIVVFACCVAEAATIPKDVFFIDTDEYPIVRAAYDVGLVTLDEPYFRPREMTTRAEFAEFLQNRYDGLKRDEPMVWLYREVLKHSKGRGKLRKVLLNAYYAGSTGRKQLATYEYMTAMIRMLSGDKLTVNSVRKAISWANKRLRAAGHLARLSSAGKSGMMRRVDAVEMLYYLVE